MISKRATHNYPTPTPNSRLANEDSMSGSGGHQVNPFYIEPAQKQQWDGDFDDDGWRDDDDDDDLEEMGLLNDNDNNARRSNTNASHHTRRRIGRTQNNYYNQNRGGTSARERKIILGTVSFFLVLIVWMATSSKSSSSTKTNKGKTPTPDSPTTPLPNNNDKNPSNSNRTHHPIPFPERVILVGERNSGVDFYQDKLTQCFPQLNIDHVLTRDTMWFQEKPPVSMDQQKQQEPQETILFILVVRDPYDWVEAMRTHPIHMPGHQLESGQPMSWPDFVEQPWTVLTPTKDNDDIATDSGNGSNATDDELFGLFDDDYVDDTGDSEGANNDDELLGLFDDDNVSTDDDNNLLFLRDLQPEICQWGFKEHQVVPCHLPTGANEKSDEQPVYELNPSTGRVFDNILQLRAAKMRHFHNQILLWWKDYRIRQGLPLVVFRYEHSVWDSLEHLTRVTGWTKEDENCHNLNVKPPPLDHALDPEFVAMLSEQVDWKTEELVDYKPKRSRH